MGRTSTCALDPRGFVRVTVLDSAEMSVDDARESFEELIRVGGPERCRTLVDIRRLKGLSKEARQHFRETTPNVCSRLALLTESPVGRVLGNFFFRTVMAGMPKQLFNDEAAAIRWLLEDS